MANMTMRSRRTAALTLTAMMARSVGSTAAEMCGLYWAQTLDDQGRLTMGVFSGTAMSPGSIVAQNDVVVPLVDMPFHNSQVHGSEDDWWWMWSNFVWDPIDLGGEHEGVDVKSAGLGMGSLVRGNSHLANVMLSQANSDSMGVHRSRDPSAGSFSYYTDSALVATDSIDAGQELYFPNGYNWFLDPKDGTRDRLDSFTVNHARVQDFVKLYHELEEKYGPELTARFRSNLWDTVQQSSVDDSVRALMPSSWGEKIPVTQQGVRSIDWLEENGICMDNIRQGPSTIPMAGKGAFAARDLGAGSIVSPSPLIHLPDRSALDMLQARLSDDHSVAMDNRIVSRQLLLNYCFGHKTSAMLLCPIGPGTSFINHSSKPNTAIRWSTHKASSLHNQEWLNMTGLELGVALGIGLTLEYVALRDIQEGEEIFIDYGPAWQAAWEEHIYTWNPTPTSAQYVSAAAMNSKELDVIRTTQEQVTEPYPISVVTSCFYEYEQTLMGNLELANQAIVEPWRPLHWGIPDYMYLRPCRILSREDYAVEGEAAKHTYTVEMRNSPNIHENQIIPDDVTLVVTGVPRDAIAFTDLTYTTDVHLQNTFRHEMIMDDAVFPQTWRSL